MLSLFKYRSSGTITSSSKIFDPLKLKMVFEHAAIVSRLSQINFMIPNTHILNRLLRSADVFDKSDPITYLGKSVTHAEGLSRSLGLYSEKNRGRPRVGDFMGKEDLNYISVDPFLSYDPLTIVSRIDQYQEDTPVKVLYHSRNDLSFTLPLRRDYSSVGVSSYLIKLDDLFIGYLGYKREYPERGVSDYIRYLLISMIEEVVNLSMVNRALDKYSLRHLDRRLKFKGIPSRDYSKDFDKVAKRLVNSKENRKGYENVLKRLPLLGGMNPLFHNGALWSNRYTAIVKIVSLFPMILFLLENESKINATRTMRYKNELSRYFKFINVLETIEEIPDPALRMTYTLHYHDIQERL